jgi:predicted cupin superfamily sugar epimerase
MTGMTATEVIERLGLVPLEGEGGLYRQTWTLSGGPGDRSPLATAIYYFLTPDTFSELHQLHADEIYHFYLGDPVELTTLALDGSVGRHLLGPDLRAGMAVQLVVPAGTWQGSRLRDGGEWALLGTTMAPGFDPARYVQGSRASLLGSYPSAAAEIAALTRR